MPQFQLQLFYIDANHIVKYVVKNYPQNSNF